MWKVDQSGEFRFSDATNPAQGLLFSPKPDQDALRRAILARFAGTNATVAEVEDYVLADTPYRETHYKSVLAGLEQTQMLQPINPRPGRRRGTYGDPQMRLTFR